MTETAEVIYSGDHGEGNEISGPNVFIQWKGTDVCLDFYCKCGRHHHVDAWFVYGLKCAPCGRTYAMPSSIALKEVTQQEQCTHVCEDEDEEVL